MVGYTYTPGDQIISLNEDCVEVESGDMVLEMDLMDLFESWLEYQLDEGLLDEDYIEETSSRNKYSHKSIAVRVARNKGDVKGTKEAIQKYDNFARGQLHGKKIGFMRHADGSESEYHPGTEKENKATIKAAKAISKAKGNEKKIKKAQQKDDQTYHREWHRVYRDADDDDVKY